MIRYILILSIILISLSIGLWKACSTSLEKYDLHRKIDETFGIHEDEHKPDVTIHLEKAWKYVPCNGTTPKCGRLE